MGGSEAEGVTTFYHQHLKNHIWIKCTTHGIKQGVAMTTRCTV